MRPSQEQLDRLLKRYAALLARKRSLRHQRPRPRPATPLAIDLSEDLQGMYYLG